MDAQRILIVGGYGVVGRRIAADLARDYPDRIVVAGRDLRRASATAVEIGHGARGCVIDVTVPSSIVSALDSVSLVMSCIDQPDRGLLNAAVERGLQYTDITPHLSELGRGAAYDRIDAAAKASGARVVMATGIIPGISNMMVRAVADALCGADEIEAAMLVSAGDALGPAQFDYFLRELVMPFEIRVDGVGYPARALSDPKPVPFPPPIGARTGYLFPFSDQILYPRTFGARTARSRLAIEPSWLGTLLSLMVRSGAARLIAGDRVRRAIARRRPDRRPSDGARFALRVEVEHDGRSSRATLVGHAQADAAAAGATGVVRSLLDGEVAAPGAWMPEQVIDPERFFARLAARGLNVKLDRDPHHRPDGRTYLA